MEKITTGVGELQGSLDKQIIQQATSGWMEANAGQVQFLGVKEVKVPNMAMTGLGAYDRNGGGYPKGNLNLVYQTLSLTQDRGAEFYFDRHDVDESNYVIQASGVMSEFQRQWVIPEIDAYRYSTIAKKVIGAGMHTVCTPTKNNILDLFLGDVRKKQDLTGLSLDSMIAVMPYSIYEMLELSAGINRTLSVSTLEQGTISLEVKSINGIAIIPVPSARMKTDYEFLGGVDEFGFKATAGAKEINWLVMPRTTPIAVSKTDSIKTFNPDQNQDGDGWKTQYRKYHDVWVMDNKLDTIVLSIKG